MREGFFGRGVFDSPGWFIDISEPRISQLQCQGNESSWKNCQYKDNSTVGTQCSTLRQFVGIVCQTGRKEQHSCAPFHEFMLNWCR